MPEKPPPTVGEVNRFGETWNGTRWEKLGRGDAPLGLNMGQRTPNTAPWNPDDTAATNEFVKQILTLGGTTVGSLLAGPPGAIGGGAIGRVIGSLPERLTAAAHRQPSQSSVLEDAPIGAMEAGTAELLPMAAGPVLRVGGRGAQALGSRLGRNTITGVPGNLMEIAGEGAEWLGNKIAPGGATLTTRLRRRLLGPEAAAPVMEDAAATAARRASLDAGADKYAATKTAQAAQRAAREGASGLPLDLGERATVTTQAVRPQAEPSDFTPYAYGDETALNDAVANLFRRLKPRTVGAHNVQIPEVP